MWKDKPRDSRKAHDDWLRNTEMLEPGSWTWNIPVPHILTRLPRHWFWGPLSWTSPSIPFASPQELIPFQHSFIPKTLKASHFQSSFNFCLNRVLSMTLTLYFIISIFRSPLGGPHVITHDVTNIPSDLMMSPTSLKIDVTSHPHIHGPLWEAWTLVLTYGILIFEALRIFPFKVLQLLLISLLCYNRISIGDIVSKMTTTLVNTEEVNVEWY